MLFKHGREYKITWLKSEDSRGVKQNRKKNDDTSFTRIVKLYCFLTRNWDNVMTIEPYLYFSSTSNQSWRCPRICEGQCASLV
jgi:hypothetical protein